MTTALAPRQKNAIKIGKDYFPVASLKEAVETWFAALRSNGWSGSECPKVTACVDKKLYRISYNGRAWVGDAPDPLVDQMIGWRSLPSSSVH